MNSPSRRDGIPWEKEKAIRLNSCTFILEIGKYLRSGKTDNTAYIRDSAACILFHRFFMGQSFKSQNRLIVGAACLFLAGKIEGCFRHISDIVRIYCKVRGMVRDKESPSESVSFDLLGVEYSRTTCMLPFLRTYWVSLASIH